MLDTLLAMIESNAGRLPGPEPVGGAVPGPLRFPREPGQHPWRSAGMDPRAAALWCGPGPVLVAVFLLEGAVRDGYRPLRHPVSSLALGPRGWIQAGNFAVAGTLFLATAAGVARAGDDAADLAAPALIGTAGRGLPARRSSPPTRSAATRQERPMHSYTPPEPALRTIWPQYRCSPACPPPRWRSWRSWRAGQRRFGLYSADTAVTMLTTMALAGAGFGQSPRLVNLGGLFQRASIITGFAWLTALSAQALRRTPTTATPR
jgi:Protein of unknown function (DUF998)